MKRHKFIFPKFKKHLLNHESKIDLIAANYLKYYFKNKNKNFYFAIKQYLHNNPSNISKIHAYCFITGRVRYTITESNVSRQIFFEFCRDGILTGYFFC